MAEAADPRRRPIWPALAFLVGFVVLLIVVANFYLLPALNAWRDTGTLTPEEKEHSRKLLSAHSALLLSILLLILLSGLLLTFRIGRYLFPGTLRKRTQTQYVDIWSEAGKRIDKQE